MLTITGLMICLPKPSPAYSKLSLHIESDAFVHVIKVELKDGSNQFVCDCLERRLCVDLFDLSISGMLQSLTRDGLLSLVEAEDVLSPCIHSQ